MRTAISDAISDFMDAVPVRVTIDGMSVDQLPGYVEVDRIGYEFNVSVNTGLKRIIERHPEEYIEDLHRQLFTDDEIVFLLSRGGSMKDESCKTCKHRQGTCCPQINETITDQDWCGNYRFKKADYIIDRYFQEQRIARSGNMIKWRPRT